MQPLRPFFSDFTKGEISPRMEGRVDIEEYVRSCRSLQNLILHPSGGIDRRPGTYYCGGAKTDSGIVMILPFVSSDEDAYVLEFTDYLLRIWDGSSLVQSGGSDLEITTPWAEEHLFELKVAQSGNNLYFAHPSYDLTKLTYSGADVWSLKSSTDNDLLCIGHDVSPFISFYTFIGGQLEKIPDPTNLPADVATDVAFSGQDSLAVAYQTSSPYMIVYNRNGDVFTKIADPATTPTGHGISASWSPDGVYLAIGHYTSPFVTIYKRSGDVLTKLANPATLPTGNCKGVEFSHDGVYLAVGHDVSPYITIYKRNGDTFTKLADPADLPAGQTNEPSWSPDDKYLACPHNNSPYITIYKRSGDTFVKLSNPGTLPTGTGSSSSWSPSGIYLAVTMTASPYIYIYKRSGDSFTKLANPASLPTSMSAGCTWDRTETYLAVTNNVTPFMTVYSRSGDTFTKLSNPGTLPAGAAYNCDFSVDGWTEIPWGVNKPSALTFHEQRLVVGRGRKVWASVVGDPQDFTQDSADASKGYEYEFASNVHELIRWMITKQHNIILGTTMGEWLMSGGDSPLSNVSVYMERVSAYGSQNIQAVAANESVLYVQKGGMRLREFVYSNERGGYLSPDLTYLADHLGEAKFVQLAWQRAPRPVLWCVMEDGELIAITVDRNHNISGWHRHPTDGTVESAAVIPTSNGEDRIYLVVNRTINGTTKKYIEYMMPLYWGSDQGDCFFVDSGLTFDYSDYTASMSGATAAEPVVVSATAHPFSNDDFVRITGVEGMTELNGNVYMVKNKAANTFELYLIDGTTELNGSGFSAYTGGGTVQKVVKSISGLSHLEAKTVHLLADGATHPTETVASGAITLDRYASKIHVGLGYTPLIQPQRLRENVTVFKRIDHLLLRFYRTLGVQAGPDTDNLETIVFRTASDPMDSPPPLYTGDKEVAFRGGFSRDGDIVITQDQPLPMSLLAIFADVLVS